MKMLLDSYLKLSDLHTDVKKQIKQELTIKNPEYQKKKAMGLPMWGCQPEIKLWKEELGQLIVPRGYYARAWEVFGEKPAIEDRRKLLEYIEFPDRPNLRDYQKPALERAKIWEQGVILMPCGAGKTESALAIIENIGQPALWITHTMDLLNQSMERAKSRLGLQGDQIGIIQGANMTIGTHITFATVQTLSKRSLDSIKNRFGCIIVDECHLAFKGPGKAKMFESVISQFPAYYRFGVTASDHRSDGLIDTMYHILGPGIYEVGQEELNAAGNVIVPEVEFIETQFFHEPEEDKPLNVQQMLVAMREDVERDEIVKSILDEKILPGDYCIVLGDSLDYLESLCSFVTEKLQRTGAFVCGETPKKTREKIMSDMKAGRYRYLFATYQLAKLGLDIPHLNKLVLVTPKRDKTSIQQASGRIMRPSEGKTTPVIYDVYDTLIPQLTHWAKDRIKVYKKLECKINGGPKVRG